MAWKITGRTHTGLVRSRNEDAVGWLQTLGVAALADGMGGLHAGDVASGEAVRSVLQQLGERRLGSGSEDISEAMLVAAVRVANKKVWSLHQNRSGAPMGTTIVVLLISPDLVIAANVGDSRLYLVRDGNIERLSKDHTIVSEQIELGIMTEEDAASSPMKHILTRTLGSSHDVDAEVFEIEPSEHDRFVLCTDGITDLIKDEEILSMTEEEESPESLCHQFIDTVLDRGAHDNATVVSVFLSGEGDRRRGTLGKFGGSVASLLRNKPKTSTRTGK